MKSRNWQGKGAQGAVRWTLLWPLLLLCLTIATLLAAPVLLNSRLVTDWALQEIEQRTGYHITTESTQVLVWGGPRVVMAKPDIRNGSASDPFFLAHRLEFAFQFWPLLDGKLVGRQLVLDRPTFTVRREGSGNWSIGTKPTVQSGEASRGPLALLDRVGTVLVTGALVTLLDESDRALRQPMRIELSRVTLTQDVPGRSATLQLAGEIPQERDRAAFTFDGTLTQLASDPAQRETAGLLQMEGEARLHHVDLPHLISAWTPLPPIADGLRGSAQASAHLRLTPRTNGYDLSVDTWSVTLSDLSIQGSAELTELGGIAPRVTATASAAPVTVTRLMSQAPSAWLSSDLRANLQGRGVDGLLTLQSLSLAGPLGSDGPWTIAGSAAVRNGRAQIDPQLPVLEDLAATLLYDAQQLRIVGLRGRSGPVRWSGEELLIMHWLDVPRYDVRVKGRGSLAGVLEIAGRLDLPSRLQDSLAQVRQAQGELDLTAHVVGGMDDKGSIPLVDLELSVEDAGFAGPWLPMPFDRIRAKVRASSTVVQVDQLEGRIGPIALTVGGTVTRTESMMLSDLRLSAVAQADEMIRLFAEEDLSRLKTTMTGLARLEAVVTGALDRPRLKGVVDLKAVEVAAPRVMTKAREVPVTLAFDVRLSDTETLQLRRAALTFGAVRVLGDGRLSLSKDQAFAVNVRSKALSVQKLPKGLSMGSMTAGTLNATLRLEGNLRDRESYRAFGQVTLDEGVVRSEYLAAPVRELAVTLRFDRDRIEVQRFSFRVGESDARITGVIDHWTQAPAARLLVQSSQLNLETLLPEAPDSTDAGSAVPAQAAWWSKGTLNATVFVDHLYHRKLFVTGLSCRIAWDHGILTVDHVSADTDDGHVAGKVVLRKEVLGNSVVRSEFRISGVPVERPLALVTDRPVLSGWLTTSGKMQGEFVQSAPQLKSFTSRRPLQVLVEDGRILDVPVITNLLSVMNLPALLRGEVDFAERGLPFHKLKLVAGIDHGAMVIKQFLLDSPVLKLSGTGKYDLMADEFDMVVAASPLGSYSRLLKTLPLFRTLLAGDRQGFDTAMFSVSGKAKEPDVRYLPAESFMNGVRGTAQLAFDILVNAINLPKDAFDLTEELIGADGGES